VKHTQTAHLRRARTPCGALIGTSRFTSGNTGLLRHAGVLITPGSTEVCCMELQMQRAGPVGAKSYTHDVMGSNLNVPWRR
jgi:hypothetical protein